MYCPPAGLAYCVFLNSSLGLCVWKFCVCDLVITCGGRREKKCVRILWVIIEAY